jgi:hypothetical protein
LNFFVDTGLRGLRVIVGGAAEPWTWRWQASMKRREQLRRGRRYCTTTHLDPHACCIHVCGFPPEKKIQESRPELFHFLEICYQLSAYSYRNTYHPAMSYKSFPFSFLLQFFCS